MKLYALILTVVLFIALYGLILSLIQIIQHKQDEKAETEKE